MNNVRKISHRIQNNSGVRQRMCFLLLWFWMALCAGSLYMFASWEVELMNACNLYAEQLERVYATGQIGVGATLIPGFLFDKFGYRATLTFAAVFIGIGTFILTSAIDVCKPNMIALGFGLLQHGSATMYQTALFTSIATASDSEKGFSAGFVSAGYGLSAAAWSFFFGFTGRNIVLFIYITGAIWTSTAVISLCLFRFLFKRQVQAHERLPDEFPPEFVPKCSVVVIGRKSRSSMEDELGEIKMDPTEVSNLCLRTILRSRAFWSTTVQFVCLQTVGSGMFIANLSLLSGSWDFTVDARRRIVGLVSFCNAAGRICGGLLGDRVTYRKAPYSFLLIGTSILMGTGVLISLSSFPALMKVAAVLLVGFAYGANWVILPADLQQRFGSKNIGVLFNIATTLMSTGVFFMSRFAGAMYDESMAEDVQGQGAFCHGFQCFGVALTTALVITTVSFIVSVWAYLCIPIYIDPASNLEQSQIL